MASHTLTQSQTTLLSAGRVRVGETTQGDYWNELQGIIAGAPNSTVANWLKGVYNTKAGIFNSLQSAIHAWISGSDTVQGTNQDGGHQAIGDDADGPIILELSIS